MLPDPLPELTALESIRRAMWGERRPTSANMRALVAAIAEAEDSEAMAQLLFWLHNVPEVVARAPVWITGNRAAALTGIGVRTGYLFLAGGHVVLFAGAGYWRDRVEEFQLVAPADSIDGLTWWNVVPGVTMRLRGQRYSLQFSPYKYQHLSADGRDLASRETSLTDVLIATAKIPLGLLAPGSEELTKLADYPQLRSDAKIAKRTRDLWRRLLADARAGVVLPRH